MSLVELIPLNKGHPIILDNTIITTIGRTPKLGCSDNRVSRNHAQLFLKSDGTVWIKSIHPNPIFYKTKTNEIVSLTKDKEYQLYDNDQFGLLPDEYFYRVAIRAMEKDKQDHFEQNSTISSSTTPKSPIKENPAEEKSESISNRTSIPDHSKVEWTSSPPAAKQTDLEEKKTIYDDDTDDEPTTTNASTAEQTSASNYVDTTANHSTTSTVARSDKRERCPYGTSCYRNNPIHRQQASHPGDSDWDTNDDDDDDEGEEEKAKPVCPYGDECYRTNPDHFNEYDHPKKRSSEIKSKHKAVQYDDDDDDDRSSDDADDEENDVDIEWKPVKNSRYLDDTDDDSTGSSDKELAKREAEEFIKSSTHKHHGHVIKKPRAEDDDDD